MKKTTQIHLRLPHGLWFWSALAALALVLAVQPAKAAPQAMIVGGVLPPGNTIWTLAGNPYQVDSYIDVPEGATLTIQEGVVVENYYGLGSQNYNFTVEGTLVVNGTELLPVHFLPGLNGWSGISITGQPGAINTGSSLSYAVLDGGGSGGSGVGANLSLQYSHVEVDHCQFINSPGDGILGDNWETEGVADVYDSSFTNNAGFAIYYEDGSVNPVLSNLTASGNGSGIGMDGNMVALHSDTLVGAHTWEAMGLPYLIVGQTAVGVDSVLTIEPGVQVLALPGNDPFNVQGQLLASGTAALPIRFDPAEPLNGWGGVKISGDEAQPSTGNVLDHVIITQGGCQQEHGLMVDYGSATVTNSHIDNSCTDGVGLYHEASLDMADTEITGSLGYAIEVWEADDDFTLARLTASGNLSDTIGIGYGSMTGEHFWPRSGINTYDIEGIFSVAPTGTLTIEQGVTLRFGVARDLTIYGTLNAIGAPAEPILFTGEAPTPGVWIGLSFYGTPEQHAVGHLAYATIEYGGYGGAPLVGIENGDVTFVHCILRFCASDAIEIQPGPTNAPLPASGQVTQGLGINWSNFVYLGGYAIQNYSSQVVQAQYNWWGAANGPSADDNPDGKGAALSGPVLYRPYITGTYLPLLRKP